MIPFTEEDSQIDSACILCKHGSRCPIKSYVNILSQKRDGKTCDDEFYCRMYEEEDDAPSEAQLDEGFVN